MPALQGERMELPPIDAREPTLVAPSPYSIAPLGIDVQQNAPKARDKQRIAVAAFAIGTLVGGLSMAIVRTAWLAHTMGMEMPSAKVTAPPVDGTALGSPPPVATTVAPVVAANPPPADPPADDSATPASADSASKHAKPKASAAHRHFSHPVSVSASAPPAFAAAAPASKAHNTSSAADDAAFMKAIKASSH